jgi:glutathione reductase (NADPH)
MSTTTNSSTKTFDLVIIGTGVAASTAAYRCLSENWKVAIIDSRPFGGTCALRGCDPKKVLVGGAELIDWDNRMEGKGVVVNSKSIQVDWHDLMRFKRSFTEPVPKNREEGFSKAGIATFHGRAQFIGPTTLKVKGGVEHDGNNNNNNNINLLEGRYVLIATGAKPAKLDILGEEYIITSDQFLELENLPEQIVFIGGGYISFEFAHIAARAGVKKITVIHRGKRPLNHFDPDLVDRLVQATHDLGIDVLLQVEVKKIEKKASGVFIVNATRKHETVVNNNDHNIAIETNMVVHGGGRVPEIDDLNLEEAGTDYDPRKGIKVNEYLQSTSNPAVYAAGDAAASGGPQLTPIAIYEGQIVSDNLIKGNHIKPNFSGVPSVVFTVPPLASVGLQEQAAKEQGINFKTNYVQDTSNWYSSRRIGEKYSGFKVLVEKEEGAAMGGRILGAHLLGHNSEEVINLFAIAIRQGISATDLKEAVFSYPTNSSDITYML